MGKGLVLILGFILLALAGIYLFIPKNIQLTQTVKAPATQEGAYRSLINKKDWTRWWPGTAEGNAFRYNKAVYETGQHSVNGIELRIKKEDKNFPGTLLFLPLAKDSVAIVWQSTVTTGFNPLQKITHYRGAKELKKEVSFILNRVRQFWSKPENIYGITVQETRVKDTVLIATKTTFNAHPATADVYTLVNKLRRYIAEHNAVETNFPMLNVRAWDSSRYEIMVAIPVNKWLPETETFMRKRMVPGNILVTEVKGGPATVKQAFTQMEYYVSDYKRKSPAIPFELLVTDRQKEKDTAKWITRIYYPVY